MGPRIADSAVGLARELMDAFVERTGVHGDTAPRRYLWTDAFAVCNLLGLEAEEDTERHGRTAQALIEQVHRVLGRHRDDDPREGWISGLGEEEGARQPTAGGLRIGKVQPERAPGEPVDDRVEWNRDGQYFHYLTKWAHALACAARSHAQPERLQQAGVLLETAAAGFVGESADGTLRMAWKMSIDLERKLVASMGHHDPLDGHVRCLEIAVRAGDADDRDLADRMRDLAARFDRMIRRDALATSDALGIGGLLMDAAALAQAVDGETVEDDGLLLSLLIASIASLRHYSGQSALDLPASQRLGFRELGLAIGLEGVAIVSECVEAKARAYADGLGLRKCLENLEDARSLGRRIVDFWRLEESRGTRTWKEHEDINDVMLATALLPDGFLRG